MSSTKEQIKQIIKSKEWNKLKDIDVSHINDFSEMFKDSDII